MRLVGNEAPGFSAKAVHKGQIIDDFSLKQFIGNKYVIFFFYPLDFTFVCPTELHAFQEKAAEFESRNVVVVACSTDSWFSHAAWLDTPKNKGGIQGVEYPIVSDFTKNIARSYEVLIEDQGLALRGLFLIDKKGIVQHQIVNNLPLGRSVNEAIRMVDALQFFESYGDVCPANWQKGDKAMAPSSEGLKSYFN